MHLKHVGQTSTSWWDGVACSKLALGGELEKPAKITSHLLEGVRELLDHKNQKS